MIAPILVRQDAAGFWLAVVPTGAGTGLAATALTGLLNWSTDEFAAAMPQSLLPADRPVRVRQALRAGRRLHDYGCVACA